MDGQMARPGGRSSCMEADDLTCEDSWMDALENSERVELDVMFTSFNSLDICRLRPNTTVSASSSKN